MPTPEGPAAPFDRGRLPGAIDVFLVRPAQANEDSLARCRERLTPEEAAACARFHHPEDRRRALLTRALVRDTLSRYVPVPPASWRFGSGPQGRPEIAEPAGTRIRFNLSHTRELVVCAVTHEVAIGVDVERFDSSRDVEGIASVVCSPAEIAAMKALRPEALADRLLSLWTLKEAYLKARGVGFTLAPRLVSFELGSEANVSASFAPEVGDDPARWWCATLDGGEGHVLAIAAAFRETPARVTLFEVDPGGVGVRVEPPTYRSVSSPGLPPWAVGGVAGAKAGG